MLRYISHNLTGIDGIAIYPIISLLIFVLFFAVIITYVIRMSKTRIEEVSATPLEDSDSDYLNETTNL